MLLRAALLHGEAAVSAWNCWAATGGLERVDPALYGLLPQLYGNLRALGIRHPLMPHLRGVVRKTWYENQLLFDAVTPVLQSLTAAGVPHMVLGEAALALLYYEDCGLRPVGVFRIAVPPGDGRRALRLIEPFGFAPALRPGSAARDPCIWALDPIRLHGPARQELELRWHALPECPNPEADLALWDAGVPLQMQGRQTLTLAPTDQLLYILIQRLLSSDAPPWQWIADAEKIVAAPSEIDWYRLVSQAYTRHTVSCVRRGLDWLTESLGLTVPPWTLEALTRRPISIDDRLEQTAATQPVPQIRRALRLWLRWRQYCESSTESWLGKVLGFTHYLACIWELEYAWQVPIYALRSGVRGRQASGLRTSRT